MKTKAKQPGATANTDFDEAIQSAPAGLRGLAIAELREFEKGTHERPVGRRDARRLLELHRHAETVTGERLTLSGTRAKSKEKNAN
jgi:hypothetical protein